MFRLFGLLLVGLVLAGCGPAGVALVGAELLAPMIPDTRLKIACWSDTGKYGKLRVGGSTRTFYLKERYLSEVNRRKNLSVVSCEDLENNSLTKTSINLPQLPLNPIPWHLTSRHSQIAYFVFMLQQMVNGIYHIRYM